MPWDETAAEILRRDLAEIPGIAERRMFGGLMFMRDGHMLVGLRAEGGLARVAPAAMARALAMPGVGPATMGTRRMTGFVAVSDAALRDDRLRRWLVAMALDGVAGLPPGP